MRVPDSPTEDAPDVGVSDNGSVLQAVSIESSSWGVTMIK